LIIEISKKNTSLYFILSSRSLIGMRKDKLVEFLIRSGFTFQVGDFIIPAFIFSKDNKTIDLRKNRFSTFNGRKSTWVKFFELIIDRYYPGLSHCREVPLIIGNRDLWENFCATEGVDCSSKILDRNYFLADYIFPEYNLIVEIDSNLHDTKYDNARDDYIRSTWGFNILRFFEFGSNPLSMGKYLDRLDQAVSPRNRNNISLDYSSYLENWFITKFPEIYNLIDQIELDLSNYIGVIKSIKLYDILQKTDLEYLQKNKLQFKMLRRYFKIIHKMGVIIKP